MDLRQLKTFVHVAELGSFSLASKRLKIAQPALSRQIRLLETELQSSLFKRHSKGASLTHSGRILLKHATAILKQIETAKVSVADSRNKISGHVIFGMPQSAGILLAVPLIERFRASYPLVTLRMIEGVGSIVHEWMIDGMLDLGVIYNPSGTNQLSTKPLWTEDLHVVGPHGMFQRGETIAFAKLAKLDITLPSMGNGLRGLVETYAQKHKVHLKILIEADAQRIQKELASIGTACTVLPRASVEDDLRLDRLSAARIIDPVIPRTLALALPTDRPTSAAGRKLGEMICVIARELAEDLSQPDLYLPTTHTVETVNIIGGA